MQYREFESRLREAGLIARDCGNGHWQAIGDRTVNYWPHVQKMHISGIGNRARNGVSVVDVIGAANYVRPAPVDTRAQRDPEPLQPVLDNQASFALVLSWIAVAFSTLALLDAIWSH